MVFLFPIENASQRVFIALCIIFTILPVTVVTARVMARRRSHKALDWSDKVMVIACAVLVIYQGVNISAVIAGGLGINAHDIENRFGIRPSQETFIKHLLAMQVLWTTDITVVKCSILILYVHIFSTDKFILAAKITMGAVVAWMLTMGIGSVFICRPFALYWDPSLPGSCGNLHAFWIFTGVYNILTDLAILILPMPYLYTLNIATYRKLVLMATFGIGFVVCIVSSIRVKALLVYRQENSTGTTIPTALLSVMEPALGIILACVPLLRSLLPARFQGSRATYDNSVSVPTPTHSKNRPVRVFSQLDENESETELRADPVEYHVGVEHGKGGRVSEGSGESGTELGSIAVKKTWQIREETVSCCKSDEEFLEARPYSQRPGSAV